MSTVINLADARLRGIDLPDDDGVAQDILDEQEAWLAHRIGALTGERSEVLYVGRDPLGKLSLSRSTDAVEVLDNSVSVNAGHIRLIDRGSAVIRSYSAASRYWTGPYVTVTYTPNDETLVRSVLYDLVALSVEPPSGKDSERLGDYSYTKGTGSMSTAAARAALVASILPKRDSMVLMDIPTRRLTDNDPVINRAEPA